jgi:hypothetical protein
LPQKRQLIVWRSSGELVLRSGAAMRGNSMQ